MDFVTGLVCATGMISGLTVWGAVFSDAPEEVVENTVFWLAMIWLATGIGLLLS